MYNMSRCKKNISFNMFCIFYIFSKCEASQRWSMSCVAPSPWLVACAPFVSSAGQPRQHHLPRHPGRSSGDPPKRDDLTRQITLKRSKSFFKYTQNGHNNIIQLHKLRRYVIRDNIQSNSTPMIWQYSINVSLKKNNHMAYDTGLDIEQ